VLTANSADGHHLYSGQFAAILASLSRASDGISYCQRRWYVLCILYTPSFVSWSLAGN